MEKKNGRNFQLSSVIIAQLINLFVRNRLVEHQCGFISVICFVQLS